MKRYSCSERDDAFGQRMLTLRTSIGLTQAGLAELLGISRRAVQEWEAGNSYPKAPYLKALLALCVRASAFPPGREEEEIRALWKAAHQKVWLDEAWLYALLKQVSPSPTPLTVEETVGVAMLHAPLPSPSATDLGQTSPPGPDPPSPGPLARKAPSGSRALVDWSDALSVPSFYGREQELATLSRWVVEEGCRMVSVLGMGGIGKSALVVHAIQQLAEHFDVVIFRSLSDAPSCDALLHDCLQVLAPESLVRLYEYPERHLNLLLKELQKRRVLLVLDNLEVLLQEGDVRGRLRPGYEGYGRLLEQVAQTAHQSCLLLTSREKPSELRTLEGRQTPVRLLRLSGLEATACEQLLNEHEVTGSPKERTRLIALYQGNPLALNIVAETIVDLFAGQIAAFLAQDTLVFGSISDLLDEHWGRLSSLEQTLLYWMAIARESVTIEKLHTLLIPSPSLSAVQMLEAVDSLHRRSLLERGQSPGGFTLQSVVLEYVTAHLIEQLTGEIVQGRLSLLIEHSLSQVQGSADVRQTQERLLLAPLLTRLQSVYQRRGEVEQRLRSLLDEVRSWAEHRQGYGPANLVTLLCLRRENLCGLDLSPLVLHGA